MLYEIRNIIELREQLDISREEEKRLRKEFWINKLRKKPERIQTTVRIIALDNESEEKEKIDFEFIQFVLKAIDR